MKTIVKSHKRNGRVVKSHARKTKRSSKSISAYNKKVGQSFDDLTADPSWVNPMHNSKPKIKPKASNKKSR